MLKYGIPNKRVLQISTGTVGITVYIRGVDVCTGIVVSRKSRIIRMNKKEYTNVEGPTNCKAATSATRQCNNNDNNNIEERLAWSG